MDITMKDIIALVILIGTFVLMYAQRLSVEQGLSIISIILGFYFGYHVGFLVARWLRNE